MIEPGPGILLIADPFLKDPNFLRSVVLLCEHQDEGSFGFVLNRPAGTTLDELVPELEGFTFPVYDGGPVQKNTLHFLHRQPELITGGQEIIKDVYWGGDFEEVIRQLISGKIEQQHIRFFLGYSGWSSGQLAQEMEEKTWLTVEAKRQLVFHANTGEIWKDAVRQLGGEYEVLIHYPIDPQLN